MKRKMSGILALIALAGCATTYGMPLEDRSRAYRADTDVVWAAALDAVDDADLALTETEREHGRIRARTGGSLLALKGHVLLVVVTDLGDGRTRVDANAELKDDFIDFGSSGNLVRDYLNALDERLGRGGAP
jgi:hypothetical protein